MTVTFATATRTTGVDEWRVAAGVEGKFSRRI